VKFPKTWELKSLHYKINAILISEDVHFEKTRMLRERGKLFEGWVSSIVGNAALIVPERKVHVAFDTPIGSPAVLENVVHSCRVSKVPPDDSGHLA
jgi:hypothetical protein